MIRSKKELGEILLNNQDLFYGGLCSWVNRLCYKRKLITRDETNYLKDLIDSKKPIFYLTNIIFNPDKKIYDDAYYWEIGFIEPRIKWIKKHLIN